MWFLLIFLALPLAEIAAFVAVGGAIGVLPTLLLVLLSGVLGVILLRTLGLRTAHEIRRSLAEESSPARPVVEAFFTLVAAILLIVPGFVTDALALLLLLPPLRAAVGRALWGFVSRHGTFTVSRPGDRRRDGVIEGEYVEVEEPGRDDDPKELPPSKWRP